MTLGDKLKKIIKNEHQLMANALKGTASGASVFLDDVSPVEHEMGVTVSGVDDLSTVKVIECGKNILDVDNAPMFGNYNKNTANWTWERTETGFKAVVNGDENFGSARLGYKVCPIDRVRGKQITLSFKRTGIAVNGRYYASIQGGDADLSEDFTYVGNSITNSKTYGEITTSEVTNGYGQLTVTIPSDESRKNLYISIYLAYGSTAVSGDVIEYSDIQIEINDKATEYEPYIDPTEHAVEADGTVNGVMGKGAPITLYTDTAGAVIDCTYNRDINKAFAELQQVIISLGGNI